MTDDARPWRQGRKVGRTIYVVVGDEPSDEDRLIGVMDAADLAARVVALHNDRFRGPAWGDLLARIHG